LGLQEKHCEKINSPGGLGIFSAGSWSEHFQDSRNNTFGWDGGWKTFVFLMFQYVSRKDNENIVFSLPEMN